MLSLQPKEQRDVHPPIGYVDLPLLSSTARTPGANAVNCGCFRGPGSLIYSVSWYPLYLIDNGIVIYLSELQMRESQQIESVEPVVS